MRNFSVLLLIFLLLATIGCSGSGQNPVQAPPTPLREFELGEGHTSLGYFDLFIDAANGEVTTVENRTISPHINVTSWLNDPNCPNDQCLYFILNSFDPFENVFNLSIFLMNPTGLSPFDPRVIFFTSPYPEDFDVRNADSWTTLYDPDSDFPESVNPFIALGKDAMNNRRLPVYPFWVAEEVELFVNPVPVDPDASLSYSVEVSWPGRCREPYEINNVQFLSDPDVPEWEGRLLVANSPASDSFTIACDVYDWQENIAEVSFYAPDILGDEDWHPMEPDPLGPAERWFATFYDISDIDAGEYETWFRAMSDEPTDQVADVYQRFWFPVYFFDPNGNGGGGTDVKPALTFLRDNGGYTDIIIKQIIGGGGEIVLMQGEPGWAQTEEYSPSIYGLGPGHNWCLFASDKGGGTSKIYNVDLNDQGNTDAPLFPADDFSSFGPQIHPDYPHNDTYTEIDFVFYSYMADGNAEIFGYDFDGTPDGYVLRITNNWAEDVDPCIYTTPDDHRTYVAFASNRNGYDNYDIYVMDVTDYPTPSFPYRITFNTANDVHPAWATTRPTAVAEIAFASNRYGDYDIFRWNMATKQVYEVVTDPGDQIDPHYSPDGSQILYASSEDEYFNIWSIAYDLDDNMKFQRTSSGKDEWAPYWGLTKN